MRVVKNAFWLSFCRIAADLLSFALFTAIARHFGPPGSGEYSYAYALGAFVAILATSGLPEYGVRQYARLLSVSERARCWRYLLTAQCLQLAAGLVVLGLTLLALDGKQANPLVVMELAVHVIGLGLSRTFYVPATAAQAMVAPAFAELACRLAAILSALLLSALGVRSLPWLLAGFPVSAVALIALSLGNAVRHGAPLRLAMGRRGLAEAARGAAPFLLSDAMNQFYARADLLLIGFFLGAASLGLYATDVKFVEVGLMPIYLLGLAAYPVLSHGAAHEPARFPSVARDFLYSVLFVSGWLAVGIYCLVPLVIVPLFGAEFALAARLAPWFALFAFAKGLEVVLYRLLYAVKRQNLYVWSLTSGTISIVVLNFLLIPPFGLAGAIGAGLISIAIIVLICLWRFRDELPLSLFGGALARLGAILTLGALIDAGLGAAGAGAWTSAIVAIAAYPLLALGCGLIPHPRRSHLFAP